MSLHLITFTTLSGNLYFRSANTESLKLLTAQQALVDYADFIKYINDEHSLPSDTKWIVFGSSYAGSLAAWLRTSFPDLVHAAVASSAPVLAKMDIPGTEIYVEVADFCSISNEGSSWQAQF